MNSAITSTGKIREIAMRIAERFAPQRVVLFGSHARGDAGEGSDVDLMVPFSEVDSPASAPPKFTILFSDCGFSKDILVSTVGRYERYRLPNTAYWPASREGQLSI